MTDHECTHADEFEQLKKMSGRVEVIELGVADLKDGQAEQIKRADETREGQARLEGRFDTFEKVILKAIDKPPVPAPAPAAPTNGNGVKGMSLMARVTIAALGVVGTALGVIAILAKFASAGGGG